MLTQYNPKQPYFNIYILRNDGREILRLWLLLLNRYISLRTETCMGGKKKYEKPSDFFIHRSLDSEPKCFSSVCQHCGVTAHAVCVHCVLRTKAAVKLNRAALLSMHALGSLHVWASECFMIGCKFRSFAIAASLWPEHWVMWCHMGSWTTVLRAVLEDAPAICLLHQCEMQACPFLMGWHWPRTIDNGSEWSDSKQQTEAYRDVTKFSMCKEYMWRWASGCRARFWTISPVSCLGACWYLCKLTQWVWRLHCCVCRNTSLHSHRIASHFSIFHINTFSFSNWVRTIL